MKFELVEIADISNGRCRIYSFLPEEEEETALEGFYHDYVTDYKQEVEDLLDRLYYIGHNRGADERFFKMWDGRPGDGVCALFDIPDAHLRLYCIRFGTDVLIVGRGGKKPTNIRTWEEDAILKRAATEMISVSEAMTEAIRERELILDIYHGLVGQMQLETKDGRN